jgi:hypothetical protein
MLNGDPTLPPIPGGWNLQYNVPPQGEALARSQTTGGFLLGGLQASLDGLINYTRYEYSFVEIDYTKGGRARFTKKEPKTGGFPSNDPVWDLTKWPPPEFPLTTVGSWLPDWPQGGRPIDIGAFPNGPGQPIPRRDANNNPTNLGPEFGTDITLFIEVWNDNLIGPDGLPAYDYGYTGFDLDQRFDENGFMRDEYLATQNP